MGCTQRSFSPQVPIHGHAARRHRAAGCRIHAASGRPSMASLRVFFPEEKKTLRFLPPARRPPYRLETVYALNVPPWPHPCGGIPRVTRRRHPCRIPLPSMAAGEAAEEGSSKTNRANHRRRGTRGNPPQPTTSHEPTTHHHGTTPAAHTTPTHALTPRTPTDKLNNNLHGDTQRTAGPQRPRSSALGPWGGAAALAIPRPPLLQLTNAAEPLPWPSSKAN